MKVRDLSDAARGQAGLRRDGLALEVEHVGEYGDHALAKQVGFRKGDILVSFDGLRDRRSESDLFAHALQQRRPGEHVTVVVLRDGEEQTFELALR